MHYRGFCVVVDVGREHLSVADIKMEKDRGVVLASERYGSAECWKYFANDGVIQRRREGGEGELGESAIVRVLKVGTATCILNLSCVVQKSNMFQIHFSECISAARLS